MNFLDKITLNPPVPLKKGIAYPFIEMANVGSYQREPENVDTKVYLSGSRFADGDTIIARITPCLQNGKGFYCHNIGEGFGSTEFIVLRPKDQTVDSRYLYYLMQTNYIREKMIKSMVGASGRQRVNNDVFTSIDISFPKIEIQRRIADILSAYDDLIENNRKQIKLLEEAAQRLYKEWFVDLRFPGYEHTKITDGVPEGWAKCSLGDVIEFDPKVQLAKDRVKQFVPMSALSTSSMVLDMAEFRETTPNSGSKFQNDDTLLARITPCLENGKTAFVHGIQSPEGAVGSTEYIVMRSKRLNPYMVYLHARTDGFRQSAINSMSGSDGRQRVKADKLQALPYLLPSATVVNQFGQFAAHIFELVFDLNEQTFQTAQARDRLLPKLMSGEVEVL